MADKQDAALLVQLAQWGTMMGLNDAQATIFAEDFDPAGASSADKPIRTVLQFGETLATLTKQGLLDRALVLDWLWIEGLWERVQPAARADRDRFGVPELYENFEALAGQRT